MSAMKTRLGTLLRKGGIGQSWIWSRSLSFTFRQRSEGGGIASDEGENSFENGMESGFVAEMDGTSGREPEMIPWVRSIIK